MMKISIESDVKGNLAPPVLDRLLTRIVAVLEKGTGLKFDVKADGQTVRLAHKAKLLRKMASRTESIAYDATENGYKVLLLDALGRIISSDERASGLSYESNLFAAKATATLLAADAGLAPRYVHHDPDILAAERGPGRHGEK